MVPLPSVAEAFFLRFPEPVHTCGPDLSLLPVYPGFSFQIRIVIDTCPADLFPHHLLTQAV